MTATTPVTKEVDIPIIKVEPQRALPEPTIMPMTPFVVPIREPEKVVTRR